MKKREKSNNVLKLLIMIFAITILVARVGSVRGIGNGGGSATSPEETSQPVIIASANPTIVDAAFKPEISSSITPNKEVYLGRTSTHSGSAIGTPDDTIKWRVTVTGPSHKWLTPDMIDLDEVGWQDLVNSNIQTFHYPLKQSDNNLVALGSCDDPDTHANDCFTEIGFSLDDNDVFTNADRIEFNSNAPNGSYIIKYELVDTLGTVGTADDQVLSNIHEVPVTLDTTGPTITNVSNNPTIPTCSDNPVNIFATVTDISGISRVWFNYNISNEFDVKAIGFRMILTEGNQYKGSISLPALNATRDDGLEVSYEVVANDTLRNLAKSLTFGYTYDCLPPTANANGPYTGQEGSEVTFDASGSSDSASGIATYEWNFGDSSPPIITQDLTVQHTYADNGNYTVTLKVTDNAGNSATSPTYALISNVNPTAKANGPYTGNEGSPVEFTCTFEDQVNDIPTCEWDFGDGTLKEIGVNVQHTYVDNGLYIVKLTVKDKDGGINIDETTATISNLPPVVTDVSLTPNPSDEGQEVTLTATFTDAGILDKHAAKIDWGDGSITDGNVDETTKKVTGSHTYLNNNDNIAYKVTVTITDVDDGNSLGSKSASQDVKNVAPTVKCNAINGKEGSEVTLVCSFENPGVLDIHTATIDWGDGTDVDDGDVNEEDGTVSGSHVYADNKDDGYQVTIKVMDEIASGSATTTATINNVDPTVELDTPEPTIEGSEVMFTATVIDPGSENLPVNLGSAGNFVILAKSGISTTGTTSITGDIGVSPIDRTGLTGFSETMDSTNLFSTSDYVIGKLYAADYTEPTPTKMTTAISDMETAYTDAAGRTDPTATELGAGNIGGMTLAPGLYKWGTGVIIPTDVTLDAQGNENAVWIFQIAKTLDVSSATQVKLIGGAQAKNIFWQTGSTVTLGTDSVFNGNILSQTDIVLNTGAALSGRALAQTAVTLDANAVIVPTGTTGGVDTHTFLWDFGDSSGPVETTEPTVKHTYLDDKEEGYTVTLKVTDDDDGIGTDTTTVIINDSAPTASFTEEPTSPEEGQPVKFTDTSTSPADEIVSWLWDFGDETPTSTEPNPTHTYMDDGLYTVTLTVTDDDGSTSTAKETKVVMNVAPVVEAEDKGPIDEGTEFSGVVATFTDKGILDTHRLAIIDWGDGTEDDGVVTESDGSGIVTGMHTYADNDEYPVTVTVWDDSFGDGYDSDTFTFTVNNVAPTVLAAANQTAAKEDVVSISTEFTDPGVLDKHTCLIDWGDDSQPTTECIITERNSPAGTVSGSHIYENGGTFTVTITVSDELDSGSNTSIAKVGDFVISLNPGWNLFSVPKVLEDNGLATLTSDLDYLIILTYKDGQWMQPTTVEPLKAYWINMEQQGKLLLRFKDTSCTGDTCPVPGARQLNAGWELIGYTDTDPLESEFALKSIEGSYSQWFGFVANTWISHIFDQTPDKMMLPGQGFWVFMTQPSTLAVLSF